MRFIIDVPDSSSATLNILGHLIFMGKGVWIGNADSSVRTLISGMEVEAA